MGCGGIIVVVVLEFVLGCYSGWLFLVCIGLWYCCYVWFG